MVDSNEKISFGFQLGVAACIPHYLLFTVDYCMSYGTTKAISRSVRLELKSILNGDSSDAAALTDEYRF